jgi:hypothetical protein
MASGFHHIEFLLANIALLEQIWFFGIAGLNPCLCRHHSINPNQWKFIATIVVHKQSSLGFQAVNLASPL